jgi:hypothetical protein
MTAIFSDMRASFLSFVGDAVEATHQVLGTEMVAVCLVIQNSFLVKNLIQRGHRAQKFCHGPVPAVRGLKNPRSQSGLMRHANQHFPCFSLVVQRETISAEKPRSRGSMARSRGTRAAT